jgi:1,4-alpha-glucan branching enzyme
MIYFDHGLGVAFTDYSFYFNDNQDIDALVYLTLANRLIKEINPNAITIAEDVSGFPGLAAPFESGGVGFDYRMSMGISDNWIKWIKELRDEDWNMGKIYFELTNKRSDEKTVSYAECHDQAMVGDKTIIFRLLDEEMYYSMSKDIPNLFIDRGIALHKMIRLVTLSTAGNGYLNFMGNEFGHPEWIDFPREGNGWSYFYARRQWSLADNENLRYKYLLDFDKSMISVAKSENLFEGTPKLIFDDNEKQILSFIRGNLIFVFNFNPSVSFFDYKVSVPQGEYRIILDSDSGEFGGFNRNNPDVKHLTINSGKAHFVSLYLPSRSVLVLKRDK